MKTYRIKEGVCGQTGCQEQHVVRRTVSVWQHLNGTPASDQFVGVHHAEAFVYEIWMVDEL
jgi:hypothetical protein